MKMKLPVYLIYLIAIMLSAFGCAKSKDTSSISEINDCDSLPNGVKMHTRAIADNDAESFSSLVSYPLQRPYPLKNIENEEQMKRYYPVLIDDSLKSVIVDATPGDWAEYGWRGWSIKKDNYIWVDEDVYSIPYISKRETEVRDSLIKADLKSIPVNLSKGWLPMQCLKGDGNEFVYRIDYKRDNSGKTLYRLCVYDGDSDLSGAPLDVMTGYREVEGSAGTATYYFQDKKGNTAIYAADIPDDSQPEIVFTNSETGDIEKEVPVINAYWLDIIKERSKASKSI